MAIIVDFETRSLCDLQECGAHVYAADPSTEIICLAYQIDDEPVQVWAPGDAPPVALHSELQRGRSVWAFNSAFDRAIWESDACERSGMRPWHVAAEQWNDVMAVCAYKALPLNLEAAAKVLGLEQQKGKEGKALIQKYCKPISKKNQTFRPIPPEDMEAIKSYAAQDIRTTRAVLEAVGNLSPAERKWWLLEQKINNRGITIDIPAVRRCIEIAEGEAARINAELSDITGGQITAATQAERISAAAGIENCRKENMGDAIKAASDPAVRRVLELRQEGSLASTKKLYRMASGVNADGRARGLMQYHGATTGREAGRRIQPQNLFRPEDAWLELGLDADCIMDAPSSADAAEFLRAMYGSPLRSIANMMRNLLVASPGHLLVAGDFNQIEARVNAALAGEESKLAAFRAVDAGEADDIYCTTAAGIYGYPVRKKTHKMERQVGKIAELASGFQGSVGAWLRFGADRLGWTEDQIKEKVAAWRAAHPNIAKSWKGYQEAATAAVARPGEVFSYRQIAYSVRGQWLLCRLPSGRVIHYFRPELCEDRFGGPSFSYEANKQLSGGGRAWRRIVAYGGLLCENVVQAVSRDIMVAAAFRCEEAGFPVVLTVHDELVCEVPVDEADPSVLEQLLSITPTWAQGWPIRAEAWAGRRYQK